MSNSHLCIGGPLGGKRADHKGKRFRIALNHWPTSLRVPFTDADIAAKTKVDDMTYVEDNMHTPQGDFTFWVPEGQTPRQTMEILLSAYEASFFMDADDD